MKPNLESGKFMMEQHEQMWLNLVFNQKHWWMVEGTDINDGNNCNEIMKDKMWSQTVN